MPDDFDFLDDRPDMRYESDLSTEEKEKYAPEIAAQKERARSGKRLGPPWTITLEDGTEITVGGEPGTT